MLRQRLPTTGRGPKKPSTAFRIPVLRSTLYSTSRNTKDRVRAALSSESPLVDLADTAFELNIEKRQEQADVLGISPEELDNRKKKLRRRLIEYGFFAAQKQ